VLSTGNTKHRWQIEDIENGSIFLVKYGDLNLKGLETSEQPHRPMCRQVFGEDVSDLIENHQVVMCGFELINKRIYFNSELLNSDKEYKTGYKDDGINCGE